ncbi:MAG: CRTAC1 family protein [Bryobacteraceae bacterium]
MGIVVLFALSGAVLLAQPVRFEDVARDAGLTFRVAHHPSPSKHLPETMAGGVAAFDYDGDGWIDIFFTNGAPIPELRKESPADWNRLFRNTGGGRFEDVTESAGLAGRGFDIGAAAGDFDNDGMVDLFVGGVRGNALYRNDGGHFEDITESAGIAGGEWSVGGGWFDWDNDGLLDLLVVNYLNWSPAADRYCGDPAAGLRVYCHPRFFEGLANRLYRNRGDGAFEDITSRVGLARFNAKSMAVAFADYDRDGRTDVFLTSDTQPNLLLRNTGSRLDEQGLLGGVAFNSDGRTISAMGADFRDYNNDGLPDIVLTALSNESFPLFRNRGRGRFGDVTRSSGMWKESLAYAGWSCGLVDFDNDGWKDIFTANSHVSDVIQRFEPAGYRQANTVFCNDRGRAFTKAVLGKPAAHRGAAFADFDHDGRIDVVVSALGEPAELWRNTSRAGNWLIVRLRGRASNRDGIGAVVRIGRQVNAMTSAVGYGSSSHAGVHFGLGSARTVDVEVQWPSGKRQRARGVPANRYLDVNEPE